MKNLLFTLLTFSLIFPAPARTETRNDPTPYAECTINSVDIVDMGMVYKVTVNVSYSVNTHRENTMVFGKLECAGALNYELQYWSGRHYDRTEVNGEHTETFWVPCWCDEFKIWAVAVCDEEQDEDIEVYPL